MSVVCCVVLDVVPLVVLRLVLRPLVVLRLVLRPLVVPVVSSSSGSLGSAGLIITVIGSHGTSGSNSGSYAITRGIRNEEQEWDTAKYLHVLLTSNTRIIWVRDVRVSLIENLNGRDRWSLC